MTADRTQAGAIDVSNYADLYGCWSWWQSPHNGKEASDRSAGATFGEALRLVSVTPHADRTAHRATFRAVCRGPRRRGCRPHYIEM